MSSKIKPVFVYSDDWKGTPIKFNWSGATYFSLKEAKEIRKAIKKAIKTAKKTQQ